MCNSGCCIHISECLCRTVQQWRRYLHNFKQCCMVLDWQIFTGRVRLAGDMTFTLSPLNFFTLTCISTGGPATTVTWTRDSTTVTEGTETVLNDPVTAQYTHTLQVINQTAGLYTCMVTNSVSNVSAELYVQGKTIVSVFMDVTSFTL